MPWNQSRLKTARRLVQGESEKFFFVLEDSAAMLSHRSENGEFVEVGRLFWQNCSADELFTCCHPGCAWPVEACQAGPAEVGMCSQLELGRSQVKPPAAQQFCVPVCLESASCASLPASPHPDSSCRWALSRFAGTGGRWHRSFLVYIKVVFTALFLFGNIN